MTGNNSIKRKRVLNLITMELKRKKKYLKKIKDVATAGF